MAKQVQSLFGVPERLVSSTANRALTTAKVFHREMAMDSSKLEEQSNLYHASEEDVLNVITMLDDSITYALIFGHNPTMTFLANTFKGDMIDNVPTCGVIILESSAQSWSEFNQSNTVRTQFIYPKMYV